MSRKNGNKPTLDPDGLTGTSGDDEIIGDATADTVYGSEGNDVLQAGDADPTTIDTLDYSTLGKEASVTISAGGVFSKFDEDGNAIGTDTTGAFEGSTITDIFDVVVAPKGGDSTVDASNVAEDGSVNNSSVAVDLDAETLEVYFTDDTGTEIVSTLLSTSIENFSDVTGGENNDTITGDDKDNVIIASGGDDLIAAGAGDDTVTGGDGADTYEFDLDGITSVGGRDADTSTNINDYSFDDLLSFGGNDTYSAQEAVNAAQTTGYLDDDETIGVELSGSGDNQILSLSADGNDDGSAINNDETFAELTISDETNFSFDIA